MITDYDSAEILVLKDGKNLQYIDESIIHKTLIYQAINNNYTALEHVPLSYFTNDFCEYAVKLHPQANKYIKNKEFIKNFKITPELYLQYVIIEPSYIMYIPEEFKTDQICQICISNSLRYLMYANNNIKLKYKVDNLTYETYLNAVKKDGLLLEYVPKEFKNDEILFEAIKNNVEAIKFSK